jgi:serine/threonine protein kinase
MKTLDHPNIVKVRELFEDSENLYIIMDRVQGKSLD